MSRWASGVCKANGIEIHYWRTGGTGESGETGASKPCLICLHGLTGSGACWTRVARDLESAYDVVMPDARGHGSSSAPRHGYRYQDHADDLAGLVQALGLATPILLGHSMGGMTAAVAAARMGSAIRAVILVEPTFLGPQRQQEVYESEVVEQHRRLLRSNRGDLLAEARRRHPARSRELSELVIDARMQTRVRAFGILTPPNPDYRELVGRIGAPILLVRGGGGVISRQVADEVEKANPLVRSVEIAAAGHAVPYDQPEGLASLVRSFVSQLPWAETVEPKACAT